MISDRHGKEKQGVRHIAGNQNPYPAFTWQFVQSDASDPAAERGGVRNRLTIISAPAGYGKSILLGEWISQRDIPVAWLSLERGENVPARFWKYFITALNEIPQVRLTGIGESISQVLDSSQPVTMEVELIKLVNSFSGIEEQVIMVLDDVHNITETQIHQDLVFLIDHLKRSIGGMHLVVAGRIDPPWPLARWRARG